MTWRTFSKNMGLVFVLLFIVGSLYSNAIGNPFIFDDKNKIEENLDIRSLHHAIYRVFRQYDGTDTYSKNDPSRPLISLIFAILYHAGDGRPNLFHLFNVIIHFLNVVLVFFLLKEILARNRGGASFAPMVGSVFFAILPVQAGTVIYAYGLSDLLSTSMMLLSLWIYLQAKRFSTFIIVSLAVLFIIGVAIKQTVVVLPILLLAADHFQIAGKNELRKKMLVPLSFLALFYLTVRLAVFGSIGDLEASGHTIKLLDYTFVQPLVLLKYVYITVLPIHLAIDHGFQMNQYPVYWFVIAMLLVLGFLIFLAMRAFRNRVEDRTWLFGAAFWFILVLPVSSFFPTTDALVERRIYGANFGLILALVFILIRIGKKIPSIWNELSRKIGILVLFSLAAMYSYRTYTRNELFSSEPAIWKESLVMNPLNPRALNNLAINYYQAGQYEKSLAAFENLSRLHPTWSSAWNNLGVLFGNKNLSFYNLDRAVFSYRRAFETNSENVLPIYNIGFLNLEAGFVDKAEQAWREALKYDPKHEQSRMMLIGLLILNKDYANAEKELKLADQLLPPSPQLQRLHGQMEKINFELKGQKN